MRQILRTTHAIERCHPGQSRCLTQAQSRPLASLLDDLRYAGNSTYGLIRRGCKRREGRPQSYSCMEPKRAYIRPGVGALVGPYGFRYCVKIVHVDHFGNQSLSDMNYFWVRHPVAVDAHRAQTAHLFPGRYAILPGACCWRIVTIMPSFFGGPATAAR